MEYYGCQNLAQFNLSFGSFEHQDNEASVVQLCCESKRPGIPFQKTAKELLEEAKLVENVEEVGNAQEQK